MTYTRFRIYRLVGPDACNRLALTRGCIVLKRPDAIKELVERHGAKDSTVRGQALEDLVAIHPRSSQYNPGRELPERGWAYRLAKRASWRKLTKKGVAAESAATP